MVELETGDDAGISASAVVAKLGSARAWQRRLLPYVFLVPSALLILVVYLYPMADLFRLSVSKANTVSGVTGFVGLANFARLFNPAFAGILIRTLVWVVVTTIGTVIAGLGLATLLDQDVPLRPLLRLLALVPWAIPQAMTAILFHFIVHLQYGLINHVLLRLGLIRTPVSFLGIHLAFYTAMVMRVWQGLPFAAMTLLAALQAVPGELYEAAEVDGATRWERFRYITIPSIQGGISTTTIILAIWSITTFDLIWVLTQGGPLGRTEILPVAIYRQAFQTYNAGLASAMGITSLAIILILTIFYYRREEGVA